MPIYHLFMEAAYEIGRQSRAHHACTVPLQRRPDAKGVERQDARRRASASRAFRARFKTLVSGTHGSDQGGIVVTHRDPERVLGPIGTFHSAHWGGVTILDRKTGPSRARPDSDVVRGARLYTKKMHEDHPAAAALIGSPSDKSSIRTAAFAELPFIFHESAPKDEGTVRQVYGLAEKKCAYRFIRRITSWL